jgi:hypothetical protein
MNTANATSPVKSPIKKHMTGKDVKCTSLCAAAWATPKLAAWIVVVGATNAISSRSVVVRLVMVGEGMRISYITVYETTSFLLLVIPSFCQKPRGSSTMAKKRDMMQEDEQEKIFPGGLSSQGAPNELRSTPACCVSSACERVRDLCVLFI